MGEEMEQQTFSDIEYSNRRKRTKREDFLDSMEEMIPWEHWVHIIRPYYPSGKKGRPPKEIETMLRMYLMQNWFNLSDAGIEDAIYDSYSKAVYRGIAKNMNRFHILFASANLVMCARAGRSKAFCMA